MMEPKTLNLIVCYKFRHEERRREIAARIDRASKRWENLNKYDEGSVKRMTKKIMPDFSFHLKSKLFFK